MLHIKEDNMSALSEITQTHNHRYAFVREMKPGEYTQIHTHVKCKDFLSDVLVSNYLDNYNHFPIYGFDYHPEIYSESEKFLVDTERTLISVRPTKDFWINNIEKLNEFEREIGFSESKILLEHKFRSKMPWYVVEGDKRWMMNYIFLGIYTLFLRLLNYKSVNLLNLSGIAEGTDSSITKRLDPNAILWMLKNWDTEFKSVPPTGNRNLSCVRGVYDGIRPYIHEYGVLSTLEHANQISFGFNKEDYSSEITQILVEKYYKPKWGMVKKFRVPPFIVDRIKPIYSWNKYEFKYNSIIFTKGTDSLHLPVKSEIDKDYFVFSVVVISKDNVQDLEKIMAEYSLYADDSDEITTYLYKG